MRNWTTSRSRRNQWCGFWWSRRAKTKEASVALANASCPWCEELGISGLSAEVRQADAAYAAVVILDLEREDLATLGSVDLCVVGAGAAGLAIALQFLDSGLRVAVVESGGLRRDDQHDGLSNGQSTGDPYDIVLSRGQARGLGGTTQLWNGQLVPLDESDFRPRPWVELSGWPFPASTLDPYYRRAFGMLGVPEGQPRPVAPQRSGLDALDPTKLAFWPSIYPPRGTLDFGMTHRAALERTPNVVVVLHATVIAIGTAAGGSHVDEIAVGSLHGRSGSVRARAFVLACGAIENPRLLLLGDRRGWPVGNDHDAVGRYLQDHPDTVCGRFLPDDGVELGEALAGRERGLKVTYRIRLAEDVRREHRVLNALGSIELIRGETAAVAALRGLVSQLRRGQRPEGTGRALRSVVRDVPSITRAFVRWRRYRSTMTEVLGALVRVQCEQAPDPDSRVALSDSEKDAFGRRVATVRWLLSDRDRLTALAYATTIRDELRRLSLGSVQVPKELDDERRDVWAPTFFSRIHPMGTTRMSVDPRTGVVDADARVHGTDNLYVAGASTFPTSGAANPTLTNVALAIRLADHLREVLRS